MSTRAGTLAIAALVTVWFAPARAEEAPAPKDGRIHVVGRARAEAAPDFASVEIGVEAKGATPAAALDAASAAAKGLIALAETFQVPEADIGTTAVTLQPVTRSVRQPDGSVTERADGYRAANTVRLRLADMGRLGDLMRRALEIGANRIEGVGFGLRDPDAAEAAVRVAAMKDATAQATRLAEAAGITLGRVVAIRSPAASGPSPDLPMPAPMAMRAKARDVRVPLVAGTIETAAEVSATFAIAP
ncbi:SIMPL domain-containing protein [Methylobacterium sp. J-090]|uniref:SIMPL domain-containing protein n=1 Tax=Methylobacterium sp. J-090 TaxID=2836666 RepID=UPI001FB90795|nr:SIMPL domain-containing protein [Methylobacterium sp. J-090]MCJ2080245.1 SIMPL domain-containing protein [Methylobacterium sp. J-090]